MQLAVLIVDSEQKTVVLDRWPECRQGPTKDAIKVRFQQPGKGGTYDSGYQMGTSVEVVVFE